MGMSRLIFNSSRHLPYNTRTSLFCKGSADFFKLFRRAFDFFTNRSIAKMPISHIPNSMSPITDGALPLTDSAKSFICFTVPDKFAVTVVSVVVPRCDDTVFFHVPNQARICENPIGRRGINGTARSPISKNHKLNCSRSVRKFLNTRFAIRNIPIMAQMYILQRKKRIPKNSMLC